MVQVQLSPCGTKHTALLMPDNFARVAQSPTNAQVLMSDSFARVAQSPTNAQVLMPDSFARGAQTLLMHKY